MKTLTDFVNGLNENVSTLVVIGERSHWIFNNDDEIDKGWADCFDIEEVVSEKATSVIVKVKCKF